MPAAREVKANKLLSFCVNDVLEVKQMGGGRSGALVIDVRAISTGHGILSTTAQC